MTRPMKRFARKGGRNGRLKTVYLTFLCAIVLLALPFAARRFLAKSLDDELPDLRGVTSRAARRMADRRSEIEIAAEHPLEPHTLEPLDNPPKVWAENLILAMATGLEYKNISIFINSFSKNVAHAQLVIFSQTPLIGWTGKKNVFMQLYKPPTTGRAAQLGFWTERFLLYDIFLRSIDHKGRVILSDARDVAFFGDPFPALPDDEIHFFQESSVYPMQQADESNIDKSDNFYLMVDCYTVRVTWTYGGSHVINAGFILGPTRKILILLRDMKIEFGRISSNCLNQFGSDQATINHIVKSGRLRISIPTHKLESNERGPVLSAFRKAAPYIVAGNKVLSTMGENPFIVIHGYINRPDLNSVVQRAFGGH